MADFQVNHELPARRLAKRPLGRILVDGGFITSGHLEQAVKVQKMTAPELLGEILVGQGLIDPLELQAVLSIQRDLASSDSAIKTAAGERLRLGELLLHAGRITEAELDSALKEQMRTGKKLGEILVRQELLTEKEIDAVLAFQKAQGGPPTPCKLRLGEILVATNQLTRSQLEEAIEKQGTSDKKIGEILVEEGFVKPHQITHGLGIQRKLLRAALIALLFLATLLTPPEATSADKSRSASAKIYVSAVVAPSMNFKILSQKPELVVTNYDIQQGFVEVPAATVIEVKSDIDYLLSFDGFGEPFKEALVQGFEGGVKIPSGGGTVLRPKTQGIVIYELSYRFTLFKNSLPGTYHWPLIISAIQT